MSYTRDFVPLVNDAALAEAVLAAARTVCGRAAGAADGGVGGFARFLDHVPGCFSFIGTGEASAPLDNPRFDVDDAALLIGARFYAAVTCRRLRAG